MELGKTIWEIELECKLQWNSYWHFFLFRIKLLISTNLAVDGTVHLIDTGNHLMTICQHCYKIVNARMSSSSIYYIYMWGYWPSIDGQACISGPKNSRLASLAFFPLAGPMQPRICLQWAAAHQPRPQFDPNRPLRGFNPSPPLTADWGIGGKFRAQLDFQSGDCTIVNFSGQYCKTSKMIKLIMMLTLWWW